MISDLYVIKISLIFDHFVSCMIVNGVCLFELFSMGEWGFEHGHIKKCQLSDKFALIL